MAETRFHPETGNLLRRGVRPMILQYGSLARELMVAGWYPDDDSDAIHSGADLAQADAVFAELRKAYAAHVRQVRKRLDLTQEEAGEIIGGGRRAFQKYESGTAPPSDAAVGLIEILAESPEHLALLRSIRRAPSGARIFRKAGRRNAEKLSA